LKDRNLNTFEKTKNLIETIDNHQGNANGANAIFRIELGFF